MFSVIIIVQGFYVVPAEKATVLSLIVCTVYLAIMTT